MLNEAIRDIGLLGKIREGGKGFGWKRKECGPK